MMRAKRALGPSSRGSRSKCHGTHNAPIFLGLRFVRLQLRKNGASKPLVWKVERTRRINAHIERVVRSSVL